MFDQLFEHPHALIRHQIAPLAEERRRYLIHCSELGTARSTLRLTAELLVTIEARLRLGDRPTSKIGLPEIEEAGTFWASRKGVPSIRAPQDPSRQRFVRIAVRWLAFMARFQPASKPTKSYEHMLVDFADFMRHERGLSPITIGARCHLVRTLLEELCKAGKPLDGVSISDIDSILPLKSMKGTMHEQQSGQMHRLSVHSLSMLSRAAGAVQVSRHRLWLLAFFNMSLYLRPHHGPMSRCFLAGQKETDPPQPFATMPF